MVGEISPVKAPLGSKWQFWAPTATLEPATTSITAAREKGGQRTVCTPESWERGRSRLSARASASERVEFIFQLPATIGWRPLCISGLLG